MGCDICNLISNVSAQNVCVRIHTYICIYIIYKIHIHIYLCMYGERERRRIKQTNVVKHY